MRSKLTMTAATLVAALALSAVASASAALPEFQQGGKALEKTVKLTGKGSGMTFGSKNHDAWSCAGSSLTGETSGSSDVANVVVKLTGCKVGLTRQGYCTSPGAELDEMITTQLSGRLGYTYKKTTTQAGLLLEPPTGKLIAECADQEKTPTVELRGSVIGGLTPINKETTKFTLEYFAGGIPAPYEQTLTHFEGEEVIHTLETAVLASKTFYQTGIKSTIEITTAEALEIKA